MLKQIGEAGRRWAAGTNPWTNVYGTARTLLALGSIGTLLFSGSTSLWHPMPGMAAGANCVGPGALSLYCLVGIDHLEIGRWIAIALLAVVASGWRPRVTGILHWWLASSYTLTATLSDGGDQVTSVLTLLLVPLCLTDSRRWHWGAPDPRPSEGGTEIARLVALSTLMMIRLQVAGIYFHAAVGKFRVEEWADGTAVYYWFTDPTHGMTPWLSAVLTPVLTNPYGVVLLTWGTLVLELALFTGLVMEKRKRRWLLLVGLFFHVGIGVVHGLLSFMLAMWAALVLFLRPAEEEIASLRHPRATLAALRARFRRRAPAPAPAPRKESPREVDEPVLV